jgi:hypothetical protein
MQAAGINWVVVLLWAALIIAIIVVMVAIFRRSG